MTLAESSNNTNYQTYEEQEESIYAEEGNDPFYCDCRRHDVRMPRWWNDRAARRECPRRGEDTEQLEEHEKLEKTSKMIKMIICVCGFTDLDAAVDTI